MLFVYKSEYGHEADEGRCRASVYSGPWHNHQCSRKPVNWEDGYGWCKQHTPSLVAAKDAEREAKWKAEWKAKKDQRAHDELVKDLLHKIADEAVALSRQEGDYDRLMDLAAQYDATTGD